MSIAPPGTAARVRPPREPEHRQRGWREGVIGGWSRDTVAIWLEAREPERFSVDGPALIEVNPSRRWSRRDHVLLGVLAGGLAAGVGFYLHVQTSCGRSHNDLCGLAIIATPAVAGTGAVAGGILGALLPAAKWVSLRPGP